MNALPSSIQATITAHPVTGQTPDALLAVLRADLLLTIWDATHAPLPEPTDRLIAVLRRLDQQLRRGKDSLLASVLRVSAQIYRRRRTSLAMMRALEAQAHRLRRAERNVNRTLAEIQ